MRIFNEDIERDEYAEFIGNEKEFLKKFKQYIPQRRTVARLTFAFKVFGFFTGVVGILLTIVGILASILGPYSDNNKYYALIFNQIVLYVLLFSILGLFFFYVWRYNISTQPTSPDLYEAGKILHQFSHDIRDFHCKIEASPAEKTSQQKAAIERSRRSLELLAQVLFATKIKVRLKVKKGDQLFRLDEQGNADSSQDSIRTLEDDICYYFMRQIQAIRKKSDAREVLVLTNIGETATMPAAFQEAYQNKSTGNIHAELEKRTMNSTACWSELMRRCSKRKFKSLIRVHINTINFPPSGRIKEMLGVLLISSEIPYAFYSYRESYIELLLSCADQMHTILKDYPV